jgi:hypothetical protein
VFSFSSAYKVCFLSRDENLYRVENRIVSSVSDVTVNIRRKTIDSS